jgi:hypothetical protein
LEQAGFSLAGNDLSFTAGGFGRSADSGAGGQRTAGQGSGGAGETASADAASARLAASSAAAAGGIDIRI